MTVGFLDRIFSWDHAPPPERLPKGERLYAIGDVHGRLDLLEDLLQQIDRDLHFNPPGHSVEIFLGDYIDRGPDSRGVLDCLIERSRRRDTVFLLGNHEESLLAFLENPDTLFEWQRNGGLQTLLSFGIEPPFRATPEQQEELSAEMRSRLSGPQIAFLGNLRQFHICGDYFFVHAGIRPGRKLHEQTADDLITIRREFLDCETSHGKMIVHGHTPVATPEILPNRINLDTGAFATGRLTCAKLEGDAVTLLQTEPKSARHDWRPRCAAEARL